MDVIVIFPTPRPQVGGLLTSNQLYIDIYALAFTMYRSYEVDNMTSCLHAIGLFVG